jgi:1-acyl-sn-glycerol-3-phosphate acyltransferase
VLIPSLPGRTSVLLKQSLMNIPILGYAMRLAGFVPVVRAQHDDVDPIRARANAVENIARAAEALQKGLHITIFPEGTRSADGHLLPFRKGPFYLAAETGAPIIPVSIHGTETMMPKGTVRLRRGTAYVTFHPAIIPARGADRYALMMQVRDSIAAGLPPQMQ